MWCTAAAVKEKKDTQISLWTDSENRLTSDRNSEECGVNVVVVRGKKQIHSFTHCRLCLLTSHDLIQIRKDRSY